MARKTNAPEKNREAILAAALTCFSEKGFAATSIQDVATRARIAKSLVLYHFESKEVLWMRTLESHVRPMVELFLRYANGDPSLTFADLLRGRFEFMSTHPHLPRLLTWLSLETAPFPAPIDEIAPRVLARAKVELGEAVGGQLRPEMIAAFAMGAVDGWFRYRKLYERVANIPEGDPEGDPEADRAFLETLLTLVPLGEEKSS